MGLLLTDGSDWQLLWFVSLVSAQRIFFLKWAGGRARTRKADAALPALHFVHAYAVASAISAIVSTFAVDAHSGAGATAEATILLSVTVVAIADTPA